MVTSSGSKELFEKQDEELSDGGPSETFFDLSDMLIAYVNSTSFDSSEGDVLS